MQAAAVKVRGVIDAIFEKVDSIVDTGVDAVTAAQNKLSEILAGLSNLCAVDQATLSFLPDTVLRVIRFACKFDMGGAFDSAQQLVERQLDKVKGRCVLDDVEGAADKVCGRGARV